MPLKPSEPNAIFLHQVRIKDGPLAGASLAEMGFFPFPAPEPIQPPNPDEMRPPEDGALEVIALDDLKRWKDEFERRKAESRKHIVGTPPDADHPYLKIKFLRRLEVELEAFDDYSRGDQRNFRVRMRIPRAEGLFCDEIKPVQIIKRTGGASQQVGKIPQDFKKTAAPANDGWVVDHNPEVGTPCKSGAGCSPYYGDHNPGFTKTEKRNDGDLEVELEDHPTGETGRTDQFEVCWACIKDGRFIGWHGCVTGIRKNTNSRDLKGDWSDSDVKFSEGPSEHFKQAMSKFNSYYNGSNAETPIP